MKIQWVLNSGYSAILGIFHTDSFLKHIDGEGKDVELLAAIRKNEDGDLHIIAFSNGVLFFSHIMTIGKDLSKSLYEARKMIYDKLMEEVSLHAEFVNIDHSVVAEWEKTWVE